MTNMNGNPTPQQTDHDSFMHPKTKKNIQMHNNTIWWQTLQEAVSYQIYTKKLAVKYVQIILIINTISVKKD